MNYEIVNGSNKLAKVATFGGDWNGGQVEGWMPGPENEDQARELARKTAVLFIDGALDSVWFDETDEEIAARAADRLDDADDANVEICRFDEEAVDAVAAEFRSRMHEEL